jgi:hypothetical protein
VFHQKIFDLEKMKAQEIKIESTTSFGKNILSTAIEKKTKKELCCKILCYQIIFNLTVGSIPV